MPLPFLMEALMQLIEAEIRVLLRNHSFTLREAIFKRDEATKEMILKTVERMREIADQL